MTEGDGRFVKATGTSFEVLEAVRELDGAGVSEIARHLDRSKSGVYKHVRTLADGGYLVRQGDGYSVGLGLWALGASARDRLPIEEGIDAVDSLAASVDRPVSLVLYESGDAVVVHVDAPRGTGPVGHDRGDVLPLHATAAGKVVLAYASEEGRERVLDGELARFTDETVTDPAALREELNAVRERRTAVDRGEFDAGVECVAAPIVKRPGDPIGAVSVTGTIDESDAASIEDSVQGLVVSAARSVEHSLGDGG